MTELHHGTVAAPLEWSDVRIFDTFKNEDGRKAHLTGEVAKALFAKAERNSSRASLRSVWRICLRQSDVCAALRPLL